jgi:arylsulfatase A-like enzyme
VDVLPTLAHALGRPQPEWSEGVLLPPYADNEPDPNRSIWAIKAWDTASHEAITQGSIMLVKGSYKLHYYFGYWKPTMPGLVQLYAIDEDPEELVDLAASRKSIADEMLAEARAKLAEINKPFL